MEREKRLNLKLQQDPSLFSRKGGSEARCQAVPLLHLTAVQNDS